MKHLLGIGLLVVVVLATACSSKKSLKDTPYAQYPAYTGTDLGLTYRAAASVFKVWSPVSDKMDLIFYAQALGGEPTQMVSMQERDGVWQAEVPGDLKGQYYAFRATIDGKEMAQVPDPYAKAVGTNGLRAQVIDLAETNPEGWADDKAPALAAKTDVVLYELQVRDLSSHPQSGIQHARKFLAFTETGTTGPDSVPTGIDHIRQLGVTHVHLLPAFDFYSLDESQPESPKYNWGYDPQNYNAPEGSFATQTDDARVRIREFKQMVQSLHRNGLRVVMDVVYNHTGRTMESNFNQLVPYYYYRQNKEGGFSDGSWCGNETASERAMVRKFMIESLVYWAREYHIDGFRFDLMGNHDIETMNLISQELHKINPSIFLYGEGWGGDSNTMADSLRAIKVNAARIDNVAMFSDDMRDGIKGHVFEDKKPGFVSGLEGQEESIKFGVVASVQHPQIDYSKVFYAKAPWAAQPHQTINYCEAHDNHTLWDKLGNSRPDATEAEKIAMHKLANTIVLTSQGVPFLHAGSEFLRTKGGNHNSYESPDSVNWLDWNRRAQYAPVVDYYRQLIALRRAHPAFRMPTAQMIAERLRFVKAEKGLVAFVLADNANGDTWKNILVAYNGTAAAQSLDLPEGSWDTVLDNGQFVTTTSSRTKTCSVAPYSAVVLKQE